MYSVNQVMYSVKYSIVEMVIYKDIQGTRTWTHDKTCTLNDNDNIIETKKHTDYDLLSETF